MVKEPAGIWKELSPKDQRFRQSRFFEPINYLRTVVVDENPEPIMVKT
jgi:hypothetical protein